MATDVPRGMLSMGSNLLASLTCTVHPVVLVSIIDSYERRHEDDKRVIGTLLGNIDKGVVEITNCFTVPHNESEDEVAVDIEFSKNMYDLHKKVNPNEVIVGWYSTGHDIIEHSVLIHEYYTRECKNPVHMVVDTGLRGHKMAIKAFVSIPFGVKDKTIGAMFTPVPLEVIYQDQERVGLEYLMKNRDKSKRMLNLPGDMAQLSNSCMDMSVNLNKIVTYVDSVVKGQTPSDPQVGRMLMNLVNSVTKMDMKAFDEIICQNMRDLLMMVYLSNLTNTQLNIGEKLNQI